LTRGERCCLRRRLAALLGGELHVTDRTDGVSGVRFCLRVPLVEAPPAPAPPPDHTVVRMLRHDDSGTHGTPSSTQMIMSPIPVRATVLIVDDSEGNRRLARRMLQQLNCTVLEASDGDELPAALARWHGTLDVVLMDLEMKRVNGCVAVARAREAGCTLPILAVTGGAGAGEEALCASMRTRVRCERMRLI
jgi:CheY-like chemotaxis protein